MSAPPRRQLHAVTFVGAVAAGVAALLLLVPVAVAVAILHCCDDANGPTLGERIAIGLMVLVLVGGASAVGGMLAAAAARFTWRVVAPRD